MTWPVSPRWRLQTSAACCSTSAGQLDLENALGELLPGFVAGRAPGNHARNVKLCHLPGNTSSGLPVMSSSSAPDRQCTALLQALLRCLLKPGAGRAGRASDPGLQALGQGAGGIMKEPLAILGGTGGLSALGMGAHWFFAAPAETGASVDSAHWKKTHGCAIGRIQARSRMKTLTAGRRRRHGRSLFQCSGSAALCGEILAAGRQTGKSSILDAATHRAICPAQGPRAVSGALAGIRRRRTRLQAITFHSIRLAPLASAVVRSGSTWRRTSPWCADQPHLARPRPGAS